MPENIRAEIIQQHRHNMRPIRIFDYLKERFGDLFHYNLSQIRYVIRKFTSENVSPAVDVGDLISWVKTLRSTPNDIDTTFVISFTQSQKTFNIVFSTLRMLGNAANEIWCADSTYQTNWQDYPVIIAGALDRCGKFHFLGLSLSTNETSNDYAFLFGAIKNAAEVHHKVKVNPRYLMSDAASQIPNGFKYTFPEVVDTDYWSLMCVFHLLKAIHAYAFNSTDHRDQIKADIKILQVSANPIVFKHAINLFLDKWRACEAKFCDYFKSEWVTKHPNWFASANLLAPNTNNPSEGINSHMKDVHTIRRRLHVTMFKETVVSMLNYKSKMYNREKERKVFSHEPNVKKDDWRIAAEYALHPTTKKKIFKFNESYYILSSEELAAKRVSDGKSARDLFLCTDASTFQIYTTEYHQRVYEVIFNENNWELSTCSCPRFMLNQICKHVLAIGLLKRTLVCPATANPLILGQKAKRGRKPNAKGALYKPKNV